MGPGGDEAHPVGHQRANAEVADGRPVRRDQRLAQVPERLDPDLAVGMHLWESDDLPEVAVGVAAGPGSGRARAGGRARAHGAVEGLGANGGVHVGGRADLAGRGRVGLEARGRQVVLGVEVAPRLAHGARLGAIEGPETGGIGDQPVGQPVRVLVVDDVRVVSAVHVSHAG